MPGATGWGKDDRQAMDELVHREVPSPNFDERALPISMVVLHYTEMEAASRLRSSACAIPKPRSARIT